MGGRREGGTWYDRERESARREVVGERENKQLHKDRSWRVPGASCTQCISVRPRKRERKRERGKSPEVETRPDTDAQAALIKEEERSAFAECAILVRARLANGRAL